jgi:hypothetical protein
MARWIARRRTVGESPRDSGSRHTRPSAGRRRPRCGMTNGHTENNGVRVVSCPNDTPGTRIRRTSCPRIAQDERAGCLVTRNTTPESDACIGPKLQNGYRISRRYRRRSRRRPGRLGRSGARNKRGLGPLFRTNATAGSINSSPATRKPSGPACPSRRPTSHMRQVDDATKKGRAGKKQASPTRPMRVVVRLNNQPAARLLRKANGGTSAPHHRPPVSSLRALVQNDERGLRV